MGKQGFNCLICGSKTKFNFNINKYFLYKCLSCGYESFFPRPKTTIQFYQEKKYFLDGQKYNKECQVIKDKAIKVKLLPQYLTYKKRLNTILSIFEKNKKTQIKLLDVGCGSGLFVYLCREKKISARGIDISEPGIKLASSLSNFCRQVDFITEYGSDKVDILTLFDVIEHV